MVPAIQFGEFQLGIRTVSALHGQLNLVPRHIDVAQAEEEFTLDTHDGRQRSGYARLLNIDQRLHGAVLQAVERSAILQKREIATRAAHVGHTLDQTLGLLRNIDVDRQRLGVVGSVLLGEHDIAAASRSVNQSLHCEVQAAIVGIIIGKPARRPLAYRHIELDIGRYRNIECLSLHI